jgi:hypothetical protein
MHHATGFVGEFLDFAFARISVHLLMFDTGGHNRNTKSDYEGYAPPYHP